MISALLLEKGGALIYSLYFGLPIYPSGEGVKCGLGIAVEATQDKIDPEVGHQDGHKGGDKVGV